METFRTVLLGCACGAAGGGLLAAQARAQTQPVANEAGPPAASQVQELVVTAQRRKENLLSVPVSVAAVSGTQLKALQVTSDEDLANLTPGLTFVRPTNNAAPFIRGVGFFSGTPGNEPGVAFYVDGVYFPSTISTLHSFSEDIDHVEVLKGPQGTLYGRNAAGGVIQVITKDPQQAPRLDVEAGYSNYNTPSVSAYATGGITKDLAADIALYYSDQNDGWGRNLNSGQEILFSHEYSWRSKLLWTPGEHTRITLIGNYADVRDDQGVIDNILPGTLTSRGHVATGGFYDTISGAVTPFGTPYGKTLQYGVSLKIDQDLGWAHAISITAWNEARGKIASDNDAQPELISAFYQGQRAQTVTQEFQLISSDTSRVKWAAGFFLFDDREGEQPFILAPADNRLFDYQTVWSYAPYAQVTAPIGWNTELTGGIRYTSDTKDLRGSIFNAAGVLTSVIDRPSVEADKVNYRVSLDHKFSEDLMAYASYSTGFRSGNYNVVSPTAPLTKPQTIDAAEVGLKGRFLDGRVTLQAAVFDYELHDLVVQFFTTGGITEQTNAASGRSRGVDFQINTAPIEGLTVGVAGALLDAQFTSFKNAVNVVPCVTPASAPACAANVPGGGFFSTPVDDTGQNLPYTEKYNFSLTGNYRREVPWGGQLELATAVGIHSGVYFDPSGENKQSPYVNWDGSVTWRAPKGRWDVGVWAKNISSNHVLANVSQLPTATVTVASAPRTFGVRLGYHFF